MTRKVMGLLIAALLIVSLVPLGSTSAQSSAYVDLISTNEQCTSGARILVTFAYGIPDDEGEYYHYWSLTNTRTSAYTDAVEGPIGPADDLVVDLLSLPVPDGTQSGDTLTLYLEVYEDVGEGYITIDFDELSWTCSDTPVEEPEVVPGCDQHMPIPTHAVVGTFVADAQAYYAPGKLTYPVITIGEAQSAWVLGQDASGVYHKIIWVCQYLWVKVDTMGPTYDDVWHSTPLPVFTIE